MTCRQRDQLPALAGEERAVADQQGAASASMICAKAGSKSSRALDVHDLQLVTDGARRHPGIAALLLDVELVGVEQYRHAGGFRSERIQQLQPLRSKQAGEECHAGEKLRLATSPVLTGSEPLMNTVGIVVVAPVRR